MPYIPNTPKDQEEMVALLGMEQLGDLFADIPADLKLPGPLNLPPPLAEGELITHVRTLAAKNINLDDYVSFLGAGIYDHLVPSAISHLVSRGEFLTAYTPYQAEVSQGVLQAIFEFQTFMANLTGMDFANASMYDGATALAEALLMACSVTGRAKVAVGANLSPQWMDVLRTYLQGQDIEIVELAFDPHTGLLALAQSPHGLAAEVAALAVAQPNFFGCLEDIDQAAQWIKSAGGLLVMAVDPLSLGVLKTPGNYGADIAVGDAGCFGNPMSFGGPSVGFLTVKGTKLLRKMPGRIVGQTVDSLGKPAYVLTLQTREQHIRREKATSNICTNQALNALMATIYLALTGNRGLQRIGYYCVQKTAYLRDRLVKAGFDLRFSAPVFKEFALQADIDWDHCGAWLLERGYLGGLPLKFMGPELADSALIAVTEARTKAQLDRFVGLLEEYRHEQV